MKIGQPLTSNIEFLYLLNKKVEKSFQNFSFEHLSDKSQTNFKVFFIKKLSHEEILKIIKEINKKLNLLNKGLKIEIDDELKIPIFKIIDLETKEVLRQIPLEEILKLRKFLKNLSEEEFKNKEILKGLLFKKEV